MAKSTKKTSRRSRTVYSKRRGTKRTTKRTTRRKTVKRKTARRAPKKSTKKTSGKKVLKRSGNKVIYAGWEDVKPKSKTDRRRMYNKCGKKCFLGPEYSYPVCTKLPSDCEIKTNGLYAAYVRSRQWKNTKVSAKAKSMLKKRGYTF